MGSGQSSYSSSLGKGVTSKVGFWAETQSPPSPFDAGGSFSLPSEAAEGLDLGDFFAAFVGVLFLGDVLKIG